MGYRGESLATYRDSEHWMDTLRRFDGRNAMEMRVPDMPADAVIDASHLEINLWLAPGVFPIRSSWSSHRSIASYLPLAAAYAHEAQKMLGNNSIVLVVTDPENEYRIVDIGGIWKIDIFAQHNELFDRMRTFRSLLKGSVKEEYSDADRELQGIYQYRLHAVERALYATAGVAAGPMIRDAFASQTPVRLDMTVAV